MYSVSIKKLPTPTRSKMDGYIKNFRDRSIFVARGTHCEVVSSALYMKLVDGTTPFIIHGFEDNLIVNTLYEVTRLGYGKVITTKIQRQLFSVQTKFICNLSLKTVN